MKLVLLYCIFPLVIFLTIPSVWSLPNKDIFMNTSGILTLSGPADSAAYSFRQLLTTISSGTPANQISLCNNGTKTYDLAKIEYSPMLNFSGYYASSPWKSTLFETNTSGILLSATIWSRGSITFPSNIDNSSIPNETKVFWTGTVSNTARIAGAFKFDTSGNLYRGVGRLENTSVIPSQPLYRFTCFDANNVAQETATIILRETVVSFNFTTCTPDANTNIINMDAIPVSTIENTDASTLIATKIQKFSLKCDPNIYVQYSIVDLNDPTNTTSISTLTDDSTATGVGYGVTSSNGARLLFGPDGSALGIPNQTKYPIGSSGTIEGNKNNPLSFQLGFSYVRKSEEPIGTGSAKSLIAITYSYQ